jgi:hypothetical protein
MGNTLGMKQTGGREASARVLVSGSETEKGTSDRRAKAHRHGNQALFLYYEHFGATYQAPLARF